jgi:hypothetical protein
MDCGHLNVGMLVTLYCEFDNSYKGTIDMIFSDSIVVLGKSNHGYRILISCITEIIVHEPIIKNSTI